MKLAEWDYLHTDAVFYETPRVEFSTDADVCGTPRMEQPVILSMKSKL